jgi:hypothetical protein
VVGGRRHEEKTPDFEDFVPECITCRKREKSAEKIVPVVAA